MTTNLIEAAVENLKSVLCDPDGRVCINGSDSDRSIAKEALDYLTAAIEAAQKVQPVIPDGMRLVPRKLSQPMKDVLTVMLTNCHTVEESYAELLAAAPEAQT